MTSPALFAVSIGCTITLTGCGQGPTICDTQAREPSGIIVRYGDAVRTYAGQRLTVTACADEATKGCTSQKLGPRHHPAYVVVGHDVVKDSSPAAVRLTITDSRGRMLFAGRVTVVPHETGPHDPDCGPDSWVGRVIATRKHTLIAE